MSRVTLHSFASRAVGSRHVLSKEADVNLCYCDESGTGDEPIAVMTGIIVDAGRMHVTKQHWENLLRYLSKRADRTIVELHTRYFYSGNGVFKNINGPDRADLISSIFNWLAIRRHCVVYTSVEKSLYEKAFKAGHIPDELDSVWRFMGFHLILAMQKYCQRRSANKGHTIFVFDNEEIQRMRFTDLIAHPPAWSDAYYGRKPKQDQLDQIVDVPYFGDSREVALIQLADFTSFFLRRYAEIKSGLVNPKYQDEEKKIDEWIKNFAKRSIGKIFLYPRSHDHAENLFYNIAPSSIRELRG